MSVEQLEQLLGRSLEDDQRSRYYDLERQNNQETGQQMMMHLASSQLTAADIEGDYARFAKQLDGAACLEVASLID